MIRYACQSPPDRQAPACHQLERTQLILDLRLMAPRTRRGFLAATKTAETRAVRACASPLQALRCPSSSEREAALTTTWFGTRLFQLTPMARVPCAPLIRDLSMLSPSGTVPWIACFAHVSRHRYIRVIAASAVESLSRERSLSGPDEIDTAASSCVRPARPVKCPRRAAARSFLK